MKHSENIHNELETLGTHLLKPNISHPYQVSNDYFQQFAADINSLLPVDSIVPSHKTPKAMDSNQNFSVPEGYFENFASSLMQKIKQNDSFIDLNVQYIATPFDSPSDSYFENFASNLLVKINEDAADPTLSYGNVPMPFQLPAATYFQDNVAQIVARIQLDELSDAPVLKSVGKDLPYHISEDYFNNFNAVQSNAESKTIAFEPAAKKKVWGWSAAAAVALLLSFGFSTLFNSNINSTNQDSIESLMVNISPESIEEYIDVNLEEFANTAIAANLVNSDNVELDSKMQSLINNISEAELNEYLNIVE